jgi:orotate phosphoribosyltransferase
MNHTEEKIAQQLLETNAIKLNITKPFTWASGWKSPIYCDNRLSLSYPQVRSFIKEKMVEAAKGTFPQTEVVAGVATAGIPQGVLIADALQLPFIYVRSKPKGHGMENMIEGKAAPNQKVLLVEDLVSTGGSSLQAASALKDAGLNVVGMLSIFTYGFPVAIQSFQDAGIELASLSNYETLIRIALQMGLITGKQTQSLESWRKDPENWRRD